MAAAFSLDKDQILEVLSLSHNATAIYATDEIIIQTANDAMIAFWGKDRSVIGKPLEEAVPELKGQPFKALLQNVLKTGITNSGESVAANLMVDGQLKTFYYDYEYLAIKNSEGQTYCVLHTAADVTELVLSRMALQKSREQEEMANKALAERERSLSLIIQQAPVSIAIFRGADYVLETVNDRALELWGRTEAEVINQSILTAMPELQAQGIKPLLDHVYQTGEPYAATELPIDLMRNGELQTAYINFVYEALYTAAGEINGLITIGFEVTSQVMARKTIEESESRFRTMAESTAIYIAVGDENSKATYFNKSWTDLTGRPLADLLETGWTDLIHPDDRDRFLNAYLKAFNGRQKFIEELRILNKAGDYRWLLATSSPRLSADGTFEGFISSCIDITENKHQQQQLQASEQQLDQILSQLPAPVVVLRGPDQVVETTNQALLAFWNKTRQQVLGKPMLEIFPELRAQPFPAQWKHVLETGEVIANRERPVKFNTPDGGQRLFYVDYYYQPLTDHTGTRTGVLATIIDVTDKVEARRQLEESAEEMQAINEEMAAANEELITTNDELFITQKHLQQMMSDLTASEGRFRELVKGAPVAIGVLIGRELVIESANDLILKIWGKTSAIVGLPLAAALPELIGQPYLALLDNVYTSGNAYYGSEAKVLLEYDGILKEVYFDFIYQPISGSDGATDTIMVIAVEVTEQVMARRKVEQAEEGLRMATESAELGTWYLNAVTNEFNASARFNQVYGFDPAEPVTYELSFNQIMPEYQQYVAESVEASLKNGEPFKVEYPLVGYTDGKQRWVRSVGKFVGDALGGNYITGVIADFTEQKMDEIRKNDFIGMVSHELKTPLTSLSALVQVVHMKLKNSDDVFIAGAMDRANTQVKKMGNMINGFLNISRLESGKISLSKQLFLLNDLINEIIAETRITNASHEINLTHCNPVTVNADYDKIGSVLSNLLSNAIKYSPKGQLVEVACTITETEVIVGVKDEGMGIKPKDIGRLFDRYYRVETKHTAHISGFGIGLYLSAEIINRHEGRIWAESEVGVGSTFYFTLPLSSN